MLTIILMLLSSVNLFSAAYRVDVTINPNEYWWGAVIDDGFLMPFTDQSQYAHNLLGDNKWNQIQPLLISSQGRYIWCDNPFEVKFNTGTIAATSQFSEIRSGTAGSTLKEVFQAVSSRYFPPSGRIPAHPFFTRPQYNSWIELTYNQNEQDLMNYAKGIVENGFPTGVLMIDDTWQSDYGTWEFNPLKFQTPKEMIRRMKAMGFQVMLWVCPFVSADSPVFRELREKRFFVRNASDDKPAMIDWWNGFSAVLDFTNPETNAYFHRILGGLMTDYGVDGFKLDGGDTPFYSGNLLSCNAKHSNAHTQAWAEFGLKYPFNEYRACWKMGGQALVQRLHDKYHTWEDLRTLIPNVMVQGLMGYAYVCPDMIGGGMWTSFLDMSKIDQELIVRSAQCHALMPMMQFSVSPWRILNPENLAICKAMADLHVRFGDYILKSAEHASKTGEPIARHMEYAFPHQGYGQINDQFMLGDEILVAPVLTKGARSRQVVFPAGKWQDEKGKVFQGPSRREVDAPLERLPWFKRM